jgi:hypothetical protein
VRDELGDHERIAVLGALHRLGEHTGDHVAAHGDLEHVPALDLSSKGGVGQWVARGGRGEERSDDEVRQGEEGQP